MNRPDPMPPWEWQLWLTTIRRVCSSVGFPLGQKDSMMKRFVLAVVGLMLISPVKGVEPKDHLNSVSVFLGVAGEGRRQRAGSVGLEYERRLGETWFIAPALEHAFGGLDFSIVTLSVGYRFNRWAVFAGPGIEWSESNHGDDPGTESEFLIRTGVLYEFEFGELIVAPHAMVDFVGNGEVGVVGVTVGMSF